MDVWTHKRCSNGNAASTDARVKRFGNSGRFEVPNPCHSAQIMFTRVRSMSHWPTMRRSVLARWPCQRATIGTADVSPRSALRLSLLLPTGIRGGRKRAPNTSRACYSDTTTSGWLSRSVSTDLGGYTSRQVRSSDLSRGKLDTSPRQSD